MEGRGARAHSRLRVTGPAAQFGRGVMQDVSDKLLGQFVSCLEQKLGETAEPVPNEPPVEESTAEEPAVDEAAPPPPVTRVPPQPAPSVARTSATPPGGDDALDLGATVLPVLLKSYWKQGAVVLVVLLALIRWIRR